MIPITIESIITEEQSEDFYALYLAAFEPMKSRAAARHVLHRDEFFNDMQNPRVAKYVARHNDGRAIGLSTLTHDLDSVPWISPEYFQARYPEHAARDAIYYLGFTLIHPEHRSAPLALAMLRAVMNTVAEARAVFAYDICAFNDTVLRFGANVESQFRRNSDVTVEAIDRQTYYGATFHGTQAPESVTAESVIGAS